MKAYEALADAFAAEGATTAFGLMGDSNMYWMTALAKRTQIRVYHVRHEGSGLAMADGWARVTGKVGVCTVTSGPGVAQLATSLIVASRARTPLVIFTGEVGIAGHYQYLDQRKFADGTEAGFVPISGVGDVYDGVRKAFYLARTESRPIILDAPRQVQGTEFDDTEPYVTSSTWIPEAQHIRPSRERLERAAQMLAKSRKPVIIVGRGAVESGAGEVVQRLARRTGALIATTLLARGWLAEDEFHAGISGLFATRVTTELFSEADCVVGVGASMNDYTIESGYLYGDAAFIHIDSQAGVIMGNGKIAGCYLQGDARATLEAIEDILAEQQVQSTGLRTPEVRAALKEPIDLTAFDIDAGTVDPRQVAVALDDALPPEMGVVLGLGHFFSFPAMLMNKPRAMNLVTPQFGCIGQGLPSAIGAAVATGKPTVLIEGDGSIMMQLHEFDTAARYGIPLLVVIMNDEALGAEYHKLRAHGMNPSIAQLSSPDLGEVARALRCRGTLVRSLEDFRDAVGEFVTAPGPMLIDVRVSRNVPSIPYRRVHFGEVA